MCSVSVAFFFSAPLPVAARSPVFYERAPHIQRVHTKPNHTKLPRRNLLEDVIKNEGDYHMAMIFDFSRQLLHKVATARHLHFVQLAQEFHLILVLSAPLF